jgi:predicted transposase YdaD
MNNANEKYKDSVFTLLFSEPDILRELFSAIEGVTLPPDIPIDINTLSDVLFRTQRNDLSFLVYNRLIVLIEHQSTVNNNIPLRFLMYIGRLYEKIVDSKKKFLKKLEKIPEPEFIVLYNGKAQYPDYKELRLTDAFKRIKGLKRKKQLELVVKIYNINKGHNPKLLGKSITLENYSILVDMIREYEQEKNSLDEAVSLAVKYCIDNNVLRDFLRKHGSEVFNMLYSEYSFEEEAAVIREEAREEGREEGREENRQYFLELLNQGLTVEEIKQRLE